MIKKLLSLILCGLMLLCLVSCDGNNANNVNNANNANKDYDTLFDTFPSVFVTENITRITFYGYYGQGKGSDVPAEDMTEIINWLGSFTIDKKVDDALDGINTHQVEIEYTDGTIIKEGLNLVVIDGTAYYIKGDTTPECYEEIISKTSLK